MFCRGVVSSLILVAILNTTQSSEPITLNGRADGYLGIWYMIGPTKDDYAYKYSGGLGTYCAKHKPFAIYHRGANKTFFCYGGATRKDNRRLLHMVSYFDHTTGQVPRPTILLDKQTNDAHDNPVISIDGDGYIWIFSTSHGTSRPSYIHRSRRPLDVSEFELVRATRQTNGQPSRIDNFSYMQVWHDQELGFRAFFTRYGYPAKRTICFMHSRDGKTWSRWQRLAAIDEGHYQVSGIGEKKVGTMFNYHPQGKGLDWRTNVYYLESNDTGKSWRTASGQTVNVPLQDSENAALVHDYQRVGRNVYLKDLRYDSHDHPVMLYLTSKGYQSGPANGPRDWNITRWTGSQWITSVVTTSDNNYDMGELHLLAGDDWRVIAPTAVGPQAYNPGGEVVIWQSRDQGHSWHERRQITNNSDRNHTYVRRVLNSHSDFVAIWADGHGRRPSTSRLYFSNRDGDVFQLPTKMDSEFATPTKVGSGQNDTPTQR